MSVASFVAQILGPLYLLVAVGILLDRERYREMLRAFLDNPALTYLGGAMALVVGLVLVNLHNVWVMQWQVVITVLGWLAILKGATLLVWPKPFLDFSASWFASDRALRITAFGGAIFGLFLTVMGYR